MCWMSSHLHWTNQEVTQHTPAGTPSGSQECSRCSLCCCRACVSSWPFSWLVQGISCRLPPTHTDSLFAGILAHPTSLGPSQQREGTLARTLCNFINWLINYLFPPSFFLSAHFRSCSFMTCTYFNLLHSCPSCFLCSSIPHVTIPIYTPPPVSAIIH